MRRRSASGLASLGAQIGGASGDRTLASWSSIAGNSSPVIPSARADLHPAARSRPRAAFAPLSNPACRCIREVVVPILGLARAKDPPRRCRVSAPGSIRPRRRLNPMPAGSRPAGRPFAREPPARGEHPGHLNRWRSRDASRRWCCRPASARSKTALQAAHRPRAIKDRQSSLRILQARSTAICVVHKPLKTRQRGFDDRTSPSASLPTRDILFPPLIRGRNPAECGDLRPFFRTTSTRLEAYFGLFSGSLAALSPTRPNHGRFGTDVET
jgi:hypothetical protein